jgi:hypothetical protein
LKFNIDLLIDLFLHLFNFTTSILPLDFSISGWIKTHGYTLDQSISDLDYSALMSDLGLPRYLSQGECTLPDFANKALDVAMSSKFVLLVFRKWFRYTYCFR